MRGLILVATLAILPVLAQNLSADNEILLDPARPSAYLEPTESDSDSDGQLAVWLRLHNNSKGAISIRTESLYIGEKVQPLTLRNGKGVLAIRPGTTVAPCYTVEGTAVPSEGRSQTINEQPYQRLSLGSACTVGATSWIPAGGSVRLRIPSGHLSSGRRIGIAFEYEWENARNLEHWVYFSSTK
ncbi:MAG: hypothetical protein KIT83_19340 [Bryobacterales bacterium]|nr:hypothetical protein [Bryobacterales bacterium]